MNESCHILRKVVRVGIMSFNKPYRNGFPIRRPNLRELVTAIIANEQRGYECVAPYKKVYRSGKNFEDRPHLLNGMSYVKKKHFIDSYETCYYEVWMKKQDKGEML